MVELNIFHYISKKSLLHRMDPRFKLVYMALFTTMTMTAEIRGLILITLLLVLALFQSQLPVVRMIKEIWKFLIFLVFIIFTRTYTYGIIPGLVFGWKLLLILLLGSILTGTTSISQLRNAIEWIFGKIPFLSRYAPRIAIMTGLTVSLVPLIFDQASEISNAQKARCFDRVKNPIKRIKRMAVPLLSRTFMKAEEIALAMESRCYSEDRTGTVLKASSKDWITLFISILICLLVYVVSNSRMFINHG